MFLEDPLILDDLMLCINLLIYLLFYHFRLNLTQVVQEMIPVVTARATLPQIRIGKIILCFLLSPLLSSLSMTSIPHCQHTIQLNLQLIKFSATPTRTQHPVPARAITTNQKKHLPAITIVAALHLTMKQRAPSHQTTRMRTLRKVTQTRLVQRMTRRKPTIIIQ